MRSEVPESTPEPGKARRSRSRSRRRVVAGIAVASLAALGIAACGGTSSNTDISNKASSYGTTLFGSLPKTGTPTNGGTITFGQLSSSQPNMIFPLADCAHTSAYNSMMQVPQWVPLYNGPNGARPEVNYQASLASKAPIESDGGKTYTIDLKHWNWSNGTPVTAQDVEFDVDLMKAAVKQAASNDCQYVPGQFPDSVTSMSAPNPNTIVFHLNKAYNPGYFLYNQLQDTNFGVFAMPSKVWNVDSTGGPHLTNWNTSPAVATKIYSYLFKQGTTPSTFASNPLWKVVDGPFKMTTFSDVNGSYNLVPNASYGGTPKPRYHEYSVVTYTSWTAELNALKTGSLDIAVQADASVIPEMASLKKDGLSVYGGGSWGFSPVYINFKDKTNSFDKIVAQPYAVQALYALEDQQAYIKGPMHGAGSPQYGPVPSSPTSPYTPKDSVTPNYPYSPTHAVALLKQHGWKVVPGGQSTCQKPGTASDECGAGIPKGTPFSGTWVQLPESITPTPDLVTEAYVSAAKQYAGIDFGLKSIGFNESENYNDATPNGKPVENSWAMNSTESFNIDFYPTQEGSFNTTGAFNTGGYSNAHADQLMTNSVFSSNPKAVITEASFLAKVPPALFLPDADELTVASKKVGGPPASWLITNYVSSNPQYWYVNK
jgi:peptide/nickel transport system substrate-binding protein